LVDCDHIGWIWKSRKLIALALRKFVAQTKAIHLLPGEHGEMFGRLEVGWENVLEGLEHKSGNISEMRNK